jgi:hypothetical protein
MLLLQASPVTIDFSREYQRKELRVAPIMECFKKRLRYFLTNPKHMPMSETFSKVEVITGWRGKRKQKDLFSLDSRQPKLPSSGVDAADRPRSAALPGA